MISRSLLKILGIFTASALFCDLPILGARKLAIESQSIHSVAKDPYSNDNEGLRHLLLDMLSAARNGDQVKVQAFISDLEIPNYENWFTATFGQEKGESWAGPYGKSLREKEKQFQDRLAQLARDEGEVAIQTVDTAKKYDTLTVPLDEYIADWKKSGVPESKRVEHIGYFYFIEGKFRWDSNVVFVNFQTPNSGAFQAAKLMRRVPPEYPEEARKKRIQGTVVLNSVIRKDGSVIVQNVASGDPVLSPAAIKAVRQWHYEPTLIDGKPVEVQTQIQVVFMLSTP